MNSFALLPVISGERIFSSSGAVAQTTSSDVTMLLAELDKGARRLQFLDLSLDHFLVEEREHIRV
jgi:hypothetical protein